VGRVAPGRFGLLPLSVESGLFAVEVEACRGQQSDLSLGQALLERCPDRPIVAGCRIRLAVEGDEGAGEEAVAVHDHGPDATVPIVTEPEPGPPGETPEEKRERVMRRLAEILRADPPDLSGSAGPITAGGFPALPTNADEFDQESAAALFAALGEFFNQHKDRGEEEGAEGPERE
jgi:hypothetical protein